MHLAGFKYAGVSVPAPAAHLRAERHRGRSTLLEAMAEHRGRRDRVLLKRRDLRDPATPTSSPRTPRPARSRRTARASSSASGCCATRGDRDRAAAHVPALLQRRRVRLARPLRHQPAQPVPARHRGPCWRAAHRGSTAPTTRHPDGTCVRDYVHVADLAALARRGRAVPSTEGQPLKRVYNLGSGDRRCRSGQIMETMARGRRGSPSSPRSGPRGARGTRTASSRRGSSRPGTSSGRCGTPLA